MPGRLDSRTGAGGFDTGSEVVRLTEEPARADATVKVFQTVVAEFRDTVNDLEETVPALKVNMADLAQWSGRSEQIGPS